MVFEIEPTLKGRFPGLQVVLGYVDGVRVENSGADLQRFKEEVLGEVEQKYSLESLKDVAIFRAYRDFFTRLAHSDEPSPEYMCVLSAPNLKMRQLGTFALKQITRTRSRSEQAILGLCCL